jgi:hypothetical protein
MKRPVSVFGDGIDGVWGIGAASAVVPVSGGTASVPGVGTGGSDSAVIFAPEPYFGLRQRASTALRAMADRFAAERAFARAWPPLEAPSLLRPTANGLRVSGFAGGSGDAWPVASCTI